LKGGSDFDSALTSALLDAQNGTGGAVPGGTIYFPPLSGTPYTFFASHSITGACALIGTGPDDVVLNFNGASGVLVADIEGFREPA